MLSREEQNRAWAQPVPDVCRRPALSVEVDETRGAKSTESYWLPRQRLEWETRDTINNRMWADTMDAGPKAVTSAMLEAHPSKGAMTMQPSASTDDRRPYRFTGSFFPDPVRPDERPRLPARSLFQNPWLSGYNVEGGDVIQEIRSTVTEDNRFLVEDASTRMAGRTFEHQWIPADVTQRIAERKIEASELLRPQQDDYQKSYLS